ncbi:SpoIID/LytB domain-containing protein [Dehalobacterium formicoaceticum]|uniref:SpoIID/LytB domain-containing protein n=1 Tax=Dehalobacterium formicoaceticum TaxID=51515 RepID=A0ABT1Y8B3_9FIRM|nr:SpoIID/LytB domain-containing protein [Dehalobacterium formicoaceticum]MCR6546803.1 SpoIID/LytB domain-containing protein [Dehalobacterium formicoaceticum]
MGKTLKKSVQFFLVCILIIWGVTPIQAKGNDEIRVCLSKGTYQGTFSIAEGSYEVMDNVMRLPVAVLEAGDVLTVNQKGTSIALTINGEDIDGFFSNITVTPEDEDELNVFSYKNTLYRHGIAISIDGGSLLVVNHLPVEYYLYGVVGQEMGYTAPEEALKSQAVVSRTFALCFQDCDRKYDVVNNTASQVYGGYSAEKNINAQCVIDAVDDTEGKVIFYQSGKRGDKELIQAYFHSNAGGYTESSENVWNEELPYLKAVRSKEDRSAEESGSTWAASCYQWEKTLSYQEIQDAIKSYLTKTASKTGIGDFDHLNLYRLNRDEKTSTSSGRVTRMEIVGTKGTVNVFRDNIRSVFGLKSTKFDIIPEGSSKAADLAIQGQNGSMSQGVHQDQLMIIDGNGKVAALNSRIETCQIVGASGISGAKSKAQGIRFVGQGNGHGVGMSQWGAIGMAQQGSTYREIIDHYYNQGTEDGTITIERY